MVVIRNWRDAAPRVGHESAIIWTLLATEGDQNVPPEVAPMKGPGHDHAARDAGPPERRLPPARGP